MDQLFQQTSANVLPPKKYAFSEYASSIRRLWSAQLLLKVKSLLPGSLYRIIVSSTQLFTPAYAAPSKSPAVDFGWLTTFIILLLIFAFD